MLEDLYNIQTNSSNTGDYTLVKNTHSHTYFLKKSDYFVEFKIFEITHLIEGTPYYLLLDEDSEYTPDVNKAEVFLEATVKWDGCTNWIIPEQQKNVCSHGCSRSDLMIISEVLLFCWEKAEELLGDKWSGKF